MPTILGTLALLIAAPAAAQTDFTALPGYVLEPVPGSHYETGVGAPTVAWDSVNDQFVMYFESRLGPWFSNQPQCGPKAGGVKWGLSRATSPDGVSWTVDGAVNFGPVDNTFYSCVVAHPHVIFDGTTWHLWFKGYQDDPATFAPGSRPWGDSEIVGVGYATSPDGITWTTAADPALQIEDDFGFPTVAKIDDEWLMMYSNTASLFRATAPDVTGPWTRDPTPVIDPNPGLPPIEDELYDPALLCEELDATPYKLFFGGFERDDGNPFGLPPETATFLHGNSADGLNWSVPFVGPEANPLFSWNLLGGSLYWRHWDVLKVGDEVWVWYTQNEGGFNRVGLAYTGADLSFDGSTISNRICFGVNWAPTTNEDVYVVDEDYVLDVVAPGVLANDSDREGHSFIARLSTNPAEGDLFLNPDGSFTYTPDPGWSGYDSFTYTAEDSDGAESAPTLVTLTVTPINDAPVGVSEVYQVDEDSSLQVLAPGVLANDEDLDGDALTAIGGTDAAYGLLALSADGSFTYSPNADFNGSDGFTYMPDDGIIAGAETTVYLDVLPTNDPPTAVDDGTYTTDYQTPLAVDALAGLLNNDTDIDGDALVAVLLSSPQHGSLDLDPSDGSFLYTPSAGYSGPDSFRYRVTDGRVLSAQATVTLEVLPNGVGTGTGSGTGTGTGIGTTTGNPTGTGTGTGAPTGTGTGMGTTTGNPTGTGTGTGVAPTGTGTGTPTGTGTGATATGSGSGTGTGGSDTDTGGAKDDCGCATSGGSAGWLAVLPLALIARRRREE